MFIITIIITVVTTNKKHTALSYGTAWMRDGIKQTKIVVTDGIFGTHNLLGSEA